MSDKLQFVGALGTRPSRGQRQTEVCRTSRAVFSLFQGGAHCNLNDSSRIRSKDSTEEFQYQYMDNMDNETQLAVFENESENDNNNGDGVDQDRSRALLVVGAIAALMLAILTIALARTKQGSEREV